LIAIGGLDGTERGYQRRFINQTCERGLKSISKETREGFFQSIKNQRRESDRADILAKAFSNETSPYEVALRLSAECSLVTEMDASSFESRFSKPSSSTQATHLQSAEEFVVTADATKSLDSSKSTKVQGNQPRIADAEKIDSLLNEFIEIVVDNSSPRPPEEFVSENSYAEIESFSPSPIPIEDSGYLMEEIDLTFTPDDPMPPGIEEDDDDSKDILICFECLSIPGNVKTHTEGFNPPSLHFLSFNWESCIKILSTNVYLMAYFINDLIFT
nr:hypothetical protein [Tanacetum cinerariifolium]